MHNMHCARLAINFEVTIELSSGNQKNVHKGDACTRRKTVSLWFGYDNEAALDQQLAIVPRRATFTVIVVHFSHSLNTDSSELSPLPDASSQHASKLLHVTALDLRASDKDLDVKWEQQF
eukprot:148124-Pelagomonas_calceolata.AAC.13